MEKIDLHIHSNLSDGTLSPKEIIDEAVKNNVKVLAIADHDTIDAYTKELFEYAKEKNVILINAVEISTKINKAGIHVLGYNFDLNNDNFKQKLSTLRNARHDYLYSVAKKLNELGYILNVEELDKIEAVTKAHISLDVISNKENETILLKEFGHIPNKGEFIETIMNEGCPAFVKKETITPKEAAELIRNAGGKVVLAHPVAYVYEDNLTDKDILQIVKDMKADGIEANYIYYDRNNNKIDEVEKWNKFANDNNLEIITIGSDFHNKDGIHPEIGFINENKEFNIKNEILIQQLKTNE
ncbi:MAG: PHP domain-containing protein [Bacilli bacterium]|nr:PHP domain-containing protein [Bacilli bacterium]